jgi:tetratricopeptide (TPR) repeat protein
MSRDVGQGWLDRALALGELGRLEDAERALREGLREDPDDPFVHALLSLVLVDLDRGDEAVASAETALALEPDLALAHAARARGLLLLERLNEAQASATEAIRLDPESADSHALLAAILIGRGRWEDALAAADEALSLEPDSESARGLRAWALAMAERGPAWQEATRETLAVAPDSSNAHALAGYALLSRGSEHAAAERFREALRLDPESEPAQAGLAEATKAAHPLFKPLFRFFMWQERLSTGWKVALVVGPLFAVRLLRSEADNPLAIGLIGAWLLFVAITWAGVPIANLALRSTSVGRAVLPSDEKRSSSAFLACVAAGVVAVVLWVAVDPGFAGTAFTLGLLAFPVGSLHSLGPRLRPIGYGLAIAIACAAFLGGTLVSVGLETAGAVLLIVSFLAAAAMLWVVRLG